MSGALGIVGGAAVLWLLLVGAVRLLQPWLSRVLPPTVRVSASWCCISIHSERVPSFLRTSRCAVAAATTPGVSEPFGDTVVDLPDSASSALSDEDSEDDDDDDADAALFAADTQRTTAAAQQRHVRRGCRARVLHTVYRLWRLFGLGARGWNKFYSIGAVVACALGVLVLAFILVNPAVVLARLLRTLQAAHTPVSAAVHVPAAAAAAAAAAVGAPAAAAPAPVLQPLVPGLTFPLDRALLMVAAVAVCGVFHELGHALAAVVQGYALQAVGVELYLLVVPKFYADIDGAVQTAPPAHALRVFCAGVWHNLVTGAAALAFTAVLSTAFLGALYTLPARGPVVTGIPPASPMAAAHVALGDALVRVGSCPVSSTADWDACIARIERAQQTGTVLQGFCVPGPHARAAGHLWNDSELDAMLRRLSFPFFFSPCSCSSCLSHNAFLLCSRVHLAWKEQRGNPNVSQCCKRDYRGHGQCFVVTVCFPSIFFPLSCLVCISHCLMAQ